MLHPSRSALRRQLAALGFVALLGAAVMSAAPALAAPAPTGSGWLRIGHFAAGGEPVDLRVDGHIVTSDITFRHVSPYVRVPAGVHDLSLTPLGSDAHPLLEVRAGVPDGGAITLGAVASRAGIVGQVYQDALPSPAAGTALVRFIHTIPDVPAVDVKVVGGTTLAKAVAYPAATGYVPIPPGTYDIDITAAGTDDVLLRVASWQARAGTLASVVVLRAPDGKLDVAAVNDAVGVARAPTGGMATGFGGMAAASPHPAPTSTVLWWVAGTVGVAVASLIAATRRSRRPVIQRSRS